jgi:hypothetical protein
MTDTAYPAEVRQHVWESLVSMLRVYAHAAGLHGKPCVVTGGPAVALVSCGGCTLAISFSADTGDATWRLTRTDCEESGEFRIDEHGALVFPVGPKELDTAALDWIDQLQHVAKVSAEHQPVSH